MRLLPVLAALSVLAVTSPMFADATGSTVYGTLTFADTTQTVYYNAYTNGDSSVSQANPVIIPATFTYVDGANMDTATFTGSTLTITDTIYDNASPFLMTYTDSAITGYTLVSDTFPGTSEFVGGVFYFNSPGADNTGVQTAVFDFSSGAAATPEPSSLVLLGTGALSLAGAARRRFRKA